MDAAGDKQYFLSTAPQCPYPDAADNDMLAGAVAFDFIMIQFYNNYCGLQSFALGSSNQNNFNYATWDNWAHTASANKNVRILLGMPGNTGAGAGYTSGSALPGHPQLLQGLLQLRRRHDLGHVADVRQHRLPGPGGQQSGRRIAAATAPPRPLRALLPPPRRRSTRAPSHPRQAARRPRWCPSGGSAVASDTPGRPSVRRPYTCAANSQWWSQCQ